MADSVYKVIELVGTSTESFEGAVAAAVKQAALSLRDLRIAEVDELDVQIEDGHDQGLPGEGQGVVQVRGRRLVGPLTSPRSGWPDASVLAVSFGGSFLWGAVAARHC